MAQNKSRQSSGNRRQQSGTGNTQTPQQKNEEQKNIEAQNQTTGSPSDETPLLHDEELKEAYSNDENFAGDPKWEDLTEENRQTYARLLQELHDSEQDQDESDDDTEGEGGDEGNTGFQEPPDNEPDFYARGAIAPMKNVIDVNAKPEVTKPKGRILKQDEEFTFDGEKVGGMVVVKEDVYREVIPFRSKRPTYILLVAAGTQYGEHTVQAKAANVSEESTKSE